MGKLYADSETRSAVDDGLGIVLVFFRHSLSISFEIFIIIFCISLFLLIKMAQAQNANCINENPFNYQDQCILDETKLNSNEKAALIFVKIYASQLNISPALVMAIIKQESPNFDFGCCILASTK